MLQRILVSFALLIGIGLALWFSVILFAGLLVIGGIAYALYAGRFFLIRKGILNPRPGVPIDEQQEQVTIIEGDFERIEDQ